MLLYTRLYKSYFINLFRAHEGKAKNKIVFVKVSKKMSKSSGRATRPIHSAVSSKSSGTSGSFDIETKRYNHPSQCKPAGRRMIYTGPGTTLFHKMTVGEKGRYVGLAPLSSEVTSEASYLYRPCADDVPDCKMKHQRAGEIGWNVQKLLKNSVLPVKIEPGRR